MTIDHHAVTPDAYASGAEDHIQNQGDANQFATQEAGSQSPEADTENEGEQNQGEHVPFPKKAVNAISRRDKEIAKLRSRIAGYESQTQQRSTSNSQTGHGESGEPNEDDYDTLADYLEARGAHKARQEQVQQVKQHQERQHQANYEAWRGERVHSLQTRAQEHARTVPDFHHTMTEYADILDSFPQHLQHAVLEAEDGLIGLYNLAKEGRLEELSSMSPTAAIYMLGRASIKGLPQFKNASTAPRPPSYHVRGSGGGGKSPTDMTGQELLKWAGI